MHEMGHHYIGRSSAQFKVVPQFAFQWDGIERLRIVKELSCFVQKSIKKRDDIVWEQITEVEHKAVDPENGQAEAEDVNKTHAGLMLAVVVLQLPSVNGQTEFGKAV